MSLKSYRNHLTVGNLILVIIFSLGIFATIQRFFFGLGSATHLSDHFSWGLWISFDVLCGVGLAAGGFVMAAVVYIFNIKSFQPIVKPAVLTAFLGYLLVIVALFYDLGKPYNIWHPIIFWNPHSVMFEVGWCVMCYTTVLFLEFIPVVFERFRMNKAYKTVKKFTIVLVILGFLFSTLHQSSLGSVFLIVPEKMHGLWYSPLLPVYFFISAVAAGLAMVIFESYLSSRAFGKHLSHTTVAELGRLIVFVLSIYLLLKIIDFNRHNTWTHFNLFSPESGMFMLEMGIGVILPIILLSVRRIRHSQTMLFWSVVLVIGGFILNRLNVGITAMESYSQSGYFPSWQEISVTIMLVTIGFLAFKYIAKNFPIFSMPHDEPVELHETVKVEYIGTN